MIAWLQRNRTSVRLAFILRLITMAAGTVLSLLWYRLLLRTMGDPLYGLFLSFFAVSRLGGLGDLGISGAVGIKAGMMLGKEENDALRRLLASARSIFLFLALLTLAGFALLSPWLPHWLHFREVEGAGPLPLLFIWAGVTSATMILAGYFNNLNYANGTVTWPILPPLITGQLLAPLIHWQLAQWHEPLWVQNLPYVAMALFSGGFAWLMLKWSHPWMGELRPLRFDLSLWKLLAVTSGWVYLCSICNAIYFNTDCLVINAGFGPELVPVYQANYKPCSLVVVLILSASFVSLPKITRWISSVNETDRRRVVTEAHRLNMVQILLGIGAALGYLALNNWFICFWLGPAYQCPFIWQVAFACNLAITTGGDAGIQIVSRCGDNGIKKMGLTAGATALLNLALAVLFMKCGTITGITFAAVISQSILSVVLGYFTCRHLGLSAARWTAKSWLLPVGIVTAGAGIKMALPGHTGWSAAGLAAGYLVLMVVAARLAGVTKEMLQSEFQTVRGMFKR